MLFAVYAINSRRLVTGTKFTDYLLTNKLRIDAFSLTSMKMVVFWDAVLCSLQSGWPTFYSDQDDN
jgi:hypothetical protein